MTWQSQIIGLLTASLVRPLVPAAAAWLILRVFKVRHPASRHAVWSAVLVGMLLLPVASVIAPHWKLPLLPSHESSVARTPLQPDDTSAYEPSGFIAGAVPSTSHAPANPGTKVFERPAPGTIVLWCYLAGVLAMAAYRLTGWMMLARVMSRSKAPRLRRLRESSDVLAPVTVGVLRPSVILPAGWMSWHASTKRAVLAHEFAHIRRGDTWISCLARLARCVYWFHPLAWWISRQVADLAELSCDAVVLEKNGDPSGYSRILLGFAETVNAGGYRAALPGLTIASRSGMGHRIDQVFDLAGGNLRRLSRPGTVLVLMGLPVMCVAAVVGLTAIKSRPPQPMTVDKVTPVPAPAPPIEIAQAQAPPSAVPAPQTAPHPPAAPKPKFDAASIKPCAPGAAVMGRGGATTTGTPAPNGLGGYFGRSPGRLDISCGSIMSMVNIAYVLNGDITLTNSPKSPGNSDQHVKGVPDWAMSARYTIETETDNPIANGPTDGPNSPAWNLMVGPMLQSLLEDRFHLKIHEGTEETPMYNLIVAKGGLKLKPMAEGECQPPETGPGGRGTIIRRLGPGDKPYCGWMGGDPNGPNRTVLGGGVPLNRLADFLSLFVVDRHVIDKTGLTTVVNIHLEYSPDDNTPCDGPPLRCQVDPNSDVPAAPTIFTAIEQQLGLKLEPTKAPHGYIAIDHVEPPTEN